MNYWVITDTHFGHEKIVESGYRPADFETKILNSIARNIQSDDVLLHTGDVSFKNGEYWFSKMAIACRGKLWIALGNHDKSANWYLTRGADFASDLIIMKYQGVRILFSHIPQEDLLGCDLNIHGHLHGGATMTRTTYLRQTSTSC